ncbi:hypothetical protein C8J57DRAFT_1324868 [Mycena rebaudengoi]|nr:hypothetical protein C8J57DRAFT_1324868 [Mycena rebaudengoi]
MKVFSNFTAAATSVTLLRILDFSQKNAFDLTGGGCAELTSVTNFAFAGNANQAWTLSGGPIFFQIVSRCNTFLTYPGAASGAIALRSQAVTSSRSTNWLISLVNPAVPTGPWNIVEAATNTSLTAWDRNPINVAPEAPLTLEERNAPDTRQQFWFVQA